jgi:WXXGXW repeat (2 copies)
MKTSLFKEQNVKTKLILATSVISTLIGVSVLSGCTTVVRAPAAQARIVYRDMPPPQVETIPAPPAVGYSWVPGHWMWQNGWVWKRGHYVTVNVPAMPTVIEERITIAPSPAHVWVRGHWHWGGNAWVWANGRWVL